MQVRKLLNEEDAVSPVIGVILMVAITVILAAVIASFVLGLGGQTNQTPQASFSFDYNSHDDESFGNVTITHDGGATIKANELVLRGEGFADTGSAPNTVGDYAVTESNTKWSEASDEGNSKITPATANGDKGGDSAVVSGDRMRAWVDNDYELDLVYESSEGDNSATLAEDNGPATS
ncbi:type IV pilin [Halorientalis salina]|uniref:type IV pilin n=1 Tax=Halorientalis salina TaxID=2932266 RepID=UPI0010AD957A|nr:type IV pilin N-terminal domain-containing protein [Halorientalis salina]